MSSIRRPPGPVRQLSLQPPARRQQVRRQRSAEDDKSLQIYANSSRKKLDSERPKVRIAWSEGRGIDKDQVEVVARQIAGKSRPSTGKTSKITTRALAGEKATILYSRQELAERLRLAWKQREESKTNIDIFLAHNAVEEHCDSRLSARANVAIPRAPICSERKKIIRVEGGRSVVDKNGREPPRGLGSSKDSNVPPPTDPDARRSTDRSKTKGPIVIHCQPNVDRSDKCESKSSNRDGPCENEILAEAGKASRYFGSTLRPEKEEVDDTKAKGERTTNEKLEQILTDSGVNNDNKEPLVNVNRADWHSSMVRAENSGKIIETSKDPYQGGLPASARIKRANFHSCTNKAFVVPVTEKPARDKFIKDNTVDRTKRTSSAPPQSRLSGPPGKAQVNIVIDAPAIAKIDSLSQETCKFLERKYRTTCNEAPVKTPISNRTIKSAPIRKRAKSAKRRVTNGGSGKDGEEDRERSRRGNRARICRETRTHDIVTMVSLVSSADSDSDIDQNSLRDDKLIYELRNKLPTTPIIKTSGNAVVLNTRKPIKSVSFQQDSFDDDKEECAKEEKKVSQTRCTVVCRGSGSALPVAEEAIAWRPEVAAVVLPVYAHVAQNEEALEIPVTDREKRCLAVPIGDLRDKKRKILRTRNVTPRAAVQRQSIMIETSETCQQVDNSTVENNERIIQTSPLSETSVSKQPDINLTISTTQADSKANTTPTEPQFQTNKEKECWHLYRRMCDKGVCVSFDTVLRGMLTPTEYRLRQKDLIEHC